MKIDGVYVPGEGYYKTAIGTKVTKVRTFAGKGTKTKFRNAPLFAARYGGVVEAWQKRRGQVVLTNCGLYRRAEIHWAQRARSADYFELKYKDWLDKEWRSK